MADFTIADVLAWARTKPADEKYDYCDARNCAVAQFGKETDRLELVSLWSAKIDEVCPGLLDAVVAPGWTFGALVKRLEELCPDTPVTASNWLTIDAYLEGPIVESVSA